MLLPVLTFSVSLIYYYYLGLGFGDIFWSWHLINNYLNYIDRACERYFACIGISIINRLQDPKPSLVFYSSRYLELMRRLKCLICY